MFGVFTNFGQTAFADTLRRLDQRPSFDDYGATGDGKTDDRAAMQKAVEAGAGGIVYGIEGKTYTLRSQVYLPSDTTIDCRGATVQFDPALGGSFVNALFWIGSPGKATGTEKAAKNVEIRNCKLRSSLGTNAYAAIMLQPGSSRIRIVGNDFKHTAGGGLKAIAVRVSQVSDVLVSGNTAEDVQNLVYVDGDESQTWEHCYNVPSAVRCTLTPDPPPPGTKMFSVPAPAQNAIGKGYGYGIIVQHTTNQFNSYRLYGPYDNGQDFTYADGLITFAKPLPSGTDVLVNLFVWNPEAAPASDLKNLTVKGNSGKRFRSGAVQINCPVHSLHNRTPFVDCIQYVSVINNKFDGAYQPQGMHNSFVTGSSRRNLALWSQDFSNPVWTKIGQNPPSPGFPSPPYDSTLTAQKLTENASNTTHRIFQKAGSMPRTALTWSCFLKAAERHRVRLALTTQAGNHGVQADFDLALGNPATSGNVGTDAGGKAGITAQGAGWYRAWVSTALEAAEAQPGIYLQTSAGETSYQGDGKSGIYAWGCQLETGMAPRVYIPTQANPASSIATQLISINGVNHFTVADNMLGPAADQCIHLEDYAAHGVVTGNTCTDAGGVGIYATAARSVLIRNNSVANSYTGCIMLDAYNPAPPNLAADAYVHNFDVRIEENKCDGRHNPSMRFGIMVASPVPAHRIELANNRIINLPASATPYIYPRK